MAKLAATVHIHNPNTGLSEIFMIGTEPPEWAAKLITNPGAWAADDDEDAVEPAAPEPPAKKAAAARKAAKKAAEPPPPPEPEGGGEDDELTTPPRGGAGSGRDEWAAFAEANDVDVDEDATRDDIISLLEAHGIIEPE